MDAVAVEHLSLSYGNVRVLSDISCRIAQGDFVGILGRNGAGKTTLAKIMLGLIAPDEGEVRLFGTPLKRFKDWDRIGYVPQRYDIDKSFPGNVGELLSLRHSKSHRHIVELLHLQEMGAKRFSELSGGQQQRVLIAFALLGNPKLLILDEPTVGVDVQSQKEFFEVLQHINAHDGVTIALVTHDVDLLTKYAKSVLCLSSKTCLQGPADRAESLLQQAYGGRAGRDGHA